MVSPQNISKIKDTKPVPKIEWNDKSVTAYTDLGLEVPETVCRWERRFLSTVDITKGPIERSVVSMVTLKAPDYLGQEKNKSSHQSVKSLFISQSAGKANGGMVFQLIQ